MIDEKVDYQGVLLDAPSTDAENLKSYLSEELPYIWGDLYKKAVPHQTNILRLSVNGFEYLFDFPAELITQKKLDPTTAVDDRLVAVHGVSQNEKRNRQDSILRGAPLGAIEVIKPEMRGGYDRGHFIAHSVGGYLYINIFPQLTNINRGWSEVGKIYRSMERYCLKNPGTYCFSRPLYIGLSSHPYRIEYGVLKADGQLWVNTFPNCRSMDEMMEIERLYKEKISTFT